MFEEQEEEDDEPPKLGFWGGIFWICFTTFFITILSASIVDTIEQAAENLGCHIRWIIAAPLPIVGNAAEHAAAVIFGYLYWYRCWLRSSDLDFRHPALCGHIMGWWLGKPVSLNFHVFETISCLMTVIMVSIIVQFAMAKTCDVSALLFHPSRSILGPMIG